MRIVCPACSAAYEVPEQRLTGRAALRCARCGERWSAPEADLPEVQADAEGADAEGADAEGADGGAEALPAVIEPVPAAGPTALAVRAERAPGGLLVPEWRPPASASPALPLAWGVSVAAVLCGVAVLILDHRAIAAFWPPMQRLYGLLRLS